jgi:hypothetical protein
MKQKFLAVCSCLALTACVNTPNTKALITPFAAVGVHSFAPPASPDRMRSIDLHTLDRVAAAEPEEAEQ